MAQMQDQYSNLSPQYKQLPVKSTISAIAMWCSASLEAILHNQVSARASEVTRGSFCQILTLIKLNFVQSFIPIFLLTVTIYRIENFKTEWKHVNFAAFWE